MTFPYLYLSTKHYSVKLNRLIFEGFNFNTP